MPSGYVKLCCDDCGGKLLLLDDSMPRLCISSSIPLSDGEMDRIAEAFENMPQGAIPILDRGIEIKTIAPEVLVCGSCGAVYEKVSNDNR